MRLFRRTRTTQAEASPPTATRDALDEQDYTVLLSLCEDAMLDEPYTNRAVYLCRLIDKLEAEMLSR